MSDLISRQAAIDAICESCACGKNYINCIERTREPTCCNRIFVLRNLPSAEPETVSECPMCPDCPDNCPLDQNEEK